MITLKFDGSQVDLFFFQFLATENPWELAVRKAFKTPDSKSLFRYKSSPPSNQEICGVFCHLARKIRFLFLHVSFVGWFGGTGTIAICSYILVTCGKFGPIMSVHKNPAHMVGCVE